ncbi:hypothetical protein D8674_012262 [Pyrus ussuriensis x Pyrus communis]|uniref:26S proteasome regulatory subunit RPN11 C-terminal domain-containing protein n=1 Tax=Pyrus ussuriensis x Pyrus communis TaxID=2448454 RepID=A0A5N5GEE8_9ROSA|nr:hypothetical protein D8674_012262 [Pyrus ussuriensis x Pyrus communis]
MDGHGFIVAGAGGGFGQPPPDGPTCHTSERVIICPTALLMMLDHFNNIVEIMQFIVVGFEMLNIAAEYKKAVEEKDELPSVKLATAKMGKQAANKHLEQLVSNFKSLDIGWTFGTC